MGRGSLESLGGKRFAFFAVYIIVTVVLLSASLWVLNFVRGKTVVEEAVALPNSFIDYAPADATYLLPESLVAMATYISANPQPQNVQVLTGMSTAEIAAFMVSDMAAGLQVDCSHCHDIQNFSLDTNADQAVADRKVKARNHLTMTADLNQNWISQLASLTVDKRPAGAQVTCATCHLGEALPVTWPADQNALPDDFRLPLTDLSVLTITARSDISLDTVQLNQYAMYHMKTSLGVGCTHCHLSRYFPSYEQPAKYYALHMQKMAQHIQATYSDVLGEQEPSCNMCHRGQILPPGAAKSASSLPAVLSSAGAAQAVTMAK